MAASADRKVTPGVTELSGVRAHIDRQACFLDPVELYYRMSLLYVVLYIA